MTGTLAYSPSHSFTTLAYLSFPQPGLDPSGLERRPLLLLDRRKGSTNPYEMLSIHICRRD